MKKLGFGMMRLPLREGGEAKDVDLEQVCAMVDTFLQRGFSYFDTAYFYHGGNSENVARQALVERYPRSRFVLADKLPVSLLKEPADQVRIFDEQLAKCGVEYFDCYLLHCLTAHYYEVAQKLDTFAFVQQKKAEGRIRHLGFSFHDSAEVLDKILTEHPEVEFVQLQINYLDWEDAEVQSRLCYETAVRHGKPVIVMEPVKGGNLVRIPAPAQQTFRRLHPDWSNPVWALRFAAGLENVRMVLSGMSDPAQLEENTAALEDPRPLNAEEQAALEQAAQLLRRGLSVPCTACRYCVDGCPKHIEIPKYFEVYNDDVLTGGSDFAARQTAYGQIAGGRAADCIACGACAKTCPQHIEIPERLKDVVRHFENA